MAKAEVTLFLTRIPKSEFTVVGDKDVDVTEMSDKDRLALYGWTGPLPNDEPIPKDLPQKERERWQAVMLAKRKETMYSKMTARPNGLWSTLGMMVGPKVLGGRLADIPSTAHPLFVAWSRKMEAAGLNLRGIPFNGRFLMYWTPLYAAAGAKGPPVESFKEYTTSERYRNDYGEITIGGMGAGYVMLQPRPDRPYTLQYERNNETVKILRKDHPGNCLRLQDHDLRPKEDAILVHEAPSVGWVVGCIGPRPKGDRNFYYSVKGNPSDVAFGEIFDQVLRAGGLASLVVLDW